MNEILAIARLVTTCFACSFLCLVGGCEEQPDVSQRSVAVFPVRDGQLWGAIDREGQIIVESIYEDVSYGFTNKAIGGADQFVGQEGLLLINQDEWCYVGSTHAHRVKPVIKDCWRAFNFGESLFGIERAPPNRGYRDGDGKVPSWTQWAGVQPAVVYDPFEMWKPPAGVLPHDRFSEGLLVVSQDGKFGYADRTGVPVIRPTYAAANTFSEGRGAVMLEDKWGFVDSEGTLVIAPQFDAPGIFDDGIALVARKDKQFPFFINRKGETLHDWHLVPTSLVLYPNYGIYSEGLARHPDRETGLDGYVDSQGAWQIFPTFTTAQPFSESLARVEATDSKKSGFIDRTGRLKIVVPNAFRISGFRHGLAWVEGYGESQQNGYINQDGEWVWQSKNY